MRYSMVLLFLFCACRERVENQPTQLSNILREFILYNKQKWNSRDVCLLSYLRTEGDTIIYQLTNVTDRDSALAIHPKFAINIDSVWIFAEIPGSVRFLGDREEKELDVLMNTVHFREGTLRCYIIPAWKLKIAGDSIYVDKDWGHIVNAPPPVLENVAPFKPPPLH